MSSGEQEVPARREHDMNGIKFAEIPYHATAYIVAMDIDDIVVSGSEVAAIRDILDLDIRTDDELTGVRNTLVKTFADASSAAREAGDWKTFDRLQTAMSASVAVVDDVLWKRGALY